MSMYEHIERVMGDPSPTGDPIAGVRWPVSMNGDVSRGWVERYDEPSLNPHGFERDEDAALYALRVLFEANDNEDFLRGVTFGWATPEGCEDLYPYIDLH